MVLTLHHPSYEQHATLNERHVADMKEDKFENEEAEEEEEELFEIDLEAVENFPPAYPWESYVTTTTHTLFANCLVPIADVSSAVPMANTKQTWLGSGSGTVIWVRGAEPLQNLSGVSSSGALSNLLQKTMNISSSFNQRK